ncbi:D-glycero-alpha-D-manno-heptose-1,7-bisphosphate 7-phosphatase [Desulfococcus sp.]|uniref:D-glycero-alpha-D-manno-heptose-1,7-bisphosphate 7-phosphatase n=1 Tax=Desulfococcus sp. TaxID=2025834 RepID=UPI0035934E5E
MINVDSPDYIKSWSEVRFIPGSLSAIKALNDAGYTVLIVTNQSAVHRRLIPVEELDRIHRRMQRAAMARGGRIAEVFICPHLPDEGCACRKPRPGLIRAAQERYDIDMENSVLVGDSAKDIECARLSGCGHAVLVETGNGKAAMAELIQKGIYPEKTAQDLAAAADWIVSMSRGQERKKSRKNY